MTTKDEALIELIEDLLEQIERVDDHGPRKKLVQRGIAAITAIKQAQDEVMVNMMPPATARDKWMYEQGRLAERDPRTHAIEQAITPETGNSASAEASAITAGNGQQAPYANCRFRICDLPGQCKGEGKCHHPSVPQAQQAQEPVSPEQTEEAWRAGWAACRDAEYVGQEAEDEAWGMSQTCANADWENAAPKQAEPEGYKLVPVEPTPEMCAAGAAYMNAPVELISKNAVSFYSAMLAAAPIPLEAKA